MGLEDYEQYAQSQMDSLRNLSLSVLEDPTFECEAFRQVDDAGWWVAVTVTGAIPLSKDCTPGLAIFLRTPWYVERGMGSHFAPPVIVEAASAAALLVNSGMGGWFTPPGRPLLSPSQPPSIQRAYP